VLDCAQLLAITTYCWPDGRAVVRLVGDLDVENAPRLFDAVVDLDLKAGQQVALDLEGVTYLDSVGASVLVACETVTREHACSFCLSSASLQARAVLELLGLDRYLDGPAHRTAYPGNLRRSPPEPEARRPCHS
jgi:anti-sigma B factor antagonist